MSNFFFAKIKWEDAACHGKPVNDFYFAEEVRKRIGKNEQITALRALCSTCPIWKDCLSWGFANETYGVWGGMTAMERLSFSNPSMSDTRQIALRSFAEHGITQMDIDEARTGEKPIFKKSSDGVGYLLDTGLLPHQVADVLGIQVDSVTRSMERKAKKK